MFNFNLLEGRCMIKVYQSNLEGWADASIRIYNLNYLVGISLIEVHISLRSRKAFDLLI